MCSMLSARLKILFNADNVDIRLYYYPFVYAPLKCGDTVGECKIYSNNRLIKTVDITVRENINYGE